MEFSHSSLSIFASFIDNKVRVVKEYVTWASFASRLACSPEATLDILPVLAASSAARPRLPPDLSFSFITSAYKQSLSFTNNDLDDHHEFLYILLDALYTLVIFYSGVFGRFTRSLFTSISISD